MSCILLAGVAFPFRTHEVIFEATIVISFFFATSGLPEYVRFLVAVGFLWAVDVLFEK
jgi:hypothetical protein